MFEEKLRSDLKEMPGLFEILNSFKGKVKLAIATGAYKIYLDLMLDSLDIHNYFDILQTSDDITNGKPYPEIYLKTAKRLSLDPNECVVLEDSSNGALAGKRAGCYSIAIPSEYSRGQEFGFCDYIAKDLLDARDHIINLI